MPTYLKQLIRWSDRGFIYAILAAMMFSSLLFRPMSDTDIFWQLKLGDITLKNGIPATEPFLSTQPDRPHVPVAWLGQVLYALLRQTVGWYGLNVVDVVLWFGGYLVVVESCRRKHGGSLAAAVALFLPHMCAFAHATVRPQTFSVLAFGLLVVLTRSNWNLAWKLILGGVLLVFWQNSHPSVVAGAIWLGSYSMAQWGAFFLRKPGGETRWATSGLAALAALATIATPAGTAIFPLSKYNTEASLFFRVGEWLPLWDFGVDWSVIELYEPGEILGFSFYSGRISAWLAIVFTLALLPFKYRRISLVDFAATFVLLGLTIWMHRFVLFWGAAMIPVWHQMLRAKDAVPPGQIAEPPLRHRLIAVGCWLLAVFVPLVARPSIWLDYQPWDAVHALQRENVRGVIYTNYFYGGIVTDTGYPDWKVTHDGRYYLYSLAEWHIHQEAREGRVPISELEDRFKPVAFFLRVGCDNTLSEALRKHPHWREIHSDDWAIVFVRR